MKGLNKMVFRKFVPKIDYIKGEAEVRNNPSEVQLRGLKIQGCDKDLPNLIFFVDWFDRAENWIPFFTQKR